ncbi:hypothetical protein MUY27_10830 [Mucilaginibacter sp. RS28]|uniref:Uncharacterized protein n=1 Tax=Mucilaginibacter straminoryzae TaxID=2932774 RepID=A0A9X1X3G2_9SPHI|nr:hypothetical protein [Mucilaginibacter straminoryzae]MCJ8210206.1 hypothetical protein [Mucilaginibacter straminoryzae]
MPTLSLSPRFYRNALYLTGLGAGILVFGLFILYRLPVTKQNMMADALLADMVISFPLAYYLLMIKPFKLRKTGVLLVISICCLMAWLILPPRQQSYIVQLRHLISLVELGFVVYAIAKIRRIRAIYQSKQALFPDSAYHLQESMVEVLGHLRPVKLLAAELAVLRYSIFAMRRERKSQVRYLSFSVYKESGYIGLFSVILFVAIIEMVGLHLLLMQHHPVIALWVSLLSGYSLFLMVADISAVVKRPVMILEDQLMLRIGIRWRAVTGIENVQEIQIVNSDMITDENCLRGGLIKSSINLSVTFKEPVQVDKLYGKSRYYHRILTTVDDPTGIIDKIKGV